MAILFICLSSKIEMISYDCVSVSVAQVVKARASNTVNQITFERGFDLCKRLILFQDEGG